MLPENDLLFSDFHIWDLPLIDKLVRPGYGHADRLGKLSYTYNVRVIPLLFQDPKMSTKKHLL